MKRSAVTALLLFLAAASPAGAAFPGGNGKIAWDGIFVMNPDGSERQRLTAGGYNPMWSPNGRKLVADSVEGEGIFVLSEDGTEITRVSATGRDPAWSPDGQKIAFVDWVFSEQRVHLFIMNADGTGRTRVTFDTIRNKDAPAWSPDGSYIAYAALEDYPSGTDWDIYAYYLAGGNTANLTDIPNHDGEDEKTPSFSPDGQGFAWGTDFPADIRVSHPDYELQVINLGFTTERYPAWSPDGRSIVFSGHGYDHPYDIFTIRLDNSELRNLTNTDGYEYAPDWQPLVNELPDCSDVTASPDVLTPANHKFVEVTVSGGTDQDGDAITLTIDSVTQDEPVTERGGGDPTAPDARTAAGGLELRAERNPQGDGRVYHVAFTASDGNGGSCSGDVTVSVPRHTRDPAVDSAPPSYDSLGS